MAGLPHADDRRFLRQTLLSGLSGFITSDYRTAEPFANCGRVYCSGD